MQARKVCTVREFNPNEEQFTRYLQNSVQNMKFFNFGVPWLKWTYDTSFDRCNIFFLKQKPKDVVWLLGVLLVGQSTPKALHKIQVIGNDTRNLIFFDGLYPFLCNMFRENSFRTLMLVKMSFWMWAQKISPLRNSIKSSSSSFQPILQPCCLYLDLHKGKIS